PSLPAEAVAAAHPAVSAWLSAPGRPALLRGLRRADPPSARQLRQALGSFPEVGDTFLGFQLLGELGRGAFGRVYLARQADLAGRPVALKVTASLGAEPQALAQLQHTHIVPIHSLHRSGPLQALCLPYFGSTTLADILEDLRGQASLPASGKELLSSLRDTRQDAASTVRDHPEVPPGANATGLATPAPARPG